MSDNEKIPREVLSLGMEIPTEVIRHFGCTSDLCRTMQVNFNQRLISITVATHGFSVSRVILAFSEFIEMMRFGVEAELLNIDESKAS